MLLARGVVLYQNSSRFADLSGNGIEFAHTFCDNRERFVFLRDLIDALFRIMFTKRKDLIFAVLLLKKENEILKRHLSLQKRGVKTNANERLSLSLICAISRRAFRHLSLVMPPTLLAWQRRFIQGKWSYKRRKPGRKGVSKSIRKLVLEMKNENLLWGCRRISDELMKLGICLHHTTVNKIIQTFRKEGKVQTARSWKNFLEAHWDSLFGMDFMTIDTLFAKRFYLLVILELKSRRIATWSLTEFPRREFVKQRIIDFSHEFPEEKYLIHDNASQFTALDFSMYDIKAVATSVAAPNMNAFTERLMGSIIREALDHFLLFSEKQVRKIIAAYVDYYNHFRPHQAIGGIPGGDPPNEGGSMRKKQILGGLHHHYFRSSA